MLMLSCTRQVNTSVLHYFGQNTDDARQGLGFYKTHDLFKDFVTRQRDVAKAHGDLVRRSALETGLIDD